MRLTKKYDGNYHQYDGTYVKPQGEDSKDWKDKCVNKLGQYEDIEEEFGVDFITLYKAATCGICVREHNTDEQEITFENVVIDFDNHLLLFKFPREEIGKGRSFSGYGKTWALTKEELE